MHAKLSPILSAAFFGSPLWVWIASLLTAFFAWLLMRFLRDRFLILLRARAFDPRYPKAQTLYQLTSSVNTLVLAALSLWASSLFFNLASDMRDVLSHLAMLALVFQCGFWASTMIDYLWEGYFRKPGEESLERRSLVHLVSLLSKITLWCVAILLILSNLGINITALLTGLGIGGVAIAFALQKVLGDFLAYVSIVLDRTFEVGDFIIVGPFRGNVERIGVRSTHVRSLSGEKLIFPNSDLLNSRIQNFKTLQERRIVFTIGVTYETPHEKLSQLPTMLREIIESQPKTRVDRCHFMSFADSALLFEIVYFVLDPDYRVYMDIQQEINLAICRRFAEAGISIAYPTRTIFVKSSGGKTSKAASNEI